jgi:hypothetical protein
MLSMTIRYGNMLSMRCYKHKLEILRFLEEIGNINLTYAMN